MSQRYLRRKGVLPEVLADTVQDIYMRIFERAAQGLPGRPQTFAFGIARSGHR